MFGFVAPEDDVSVEGPARSRASSEFAERAWCGECGSHLWMRDRGGDYELSPGLFDEARPFPLVREVYADRAFAACPWPESGSGSRAPSMKAITNSLPKETRDDHL